MLRPSTFSRWCVLLLLALLVPHAPMAAQPSAAVAPQPPAATAKAEPTVPVDPQITVGTLPNGLRYYVRPNRVPRGRAELRLVVKAGSVLEDDDQRGLAHFVEHMAFNGTRRFPGRRIADILQGLGMQVGAHVNARTGFDETVYELQVPSAPAALNQALEIMHEWAHAVALDPAEIDRERGVILEEWRLGLGADARMRDATIPVLLQGSQYVNRLPIGLPDTIRTAPPERLRAFYRDWYRPDVMAVIAVGDFEGAAVEATIRARFGDLVAPATSRPRPDHRVPDHPDTRYVVATDREARATLVTIVRKMAARAEGTESVYRAQMIERLFAGMLSERLGEIARTPGAPFQAARTDRSPFVRSTDAITVQALVADGRAPEAVTALLAETERVARHGFTATELTRQKVSSQRYLVQALREKDNSESGPLADEFIRNFLTGEPIPGIVGEQAMAERLMPGITLADVNRLAATWAAEGNRVVVVQAPDRPGITPPTPAALAAAVARAADGSLTAYTDTTSDAPLVETLPPAGSIARTTEISAAGITEWRLSNGARVVVRPTDVRSDEVLFRAFSPGGLSMASDNDLVAAITADEVVAEGGLGRLNRVDLQRRLSVVTAAVAPRFDDTEEGLVGGSSRADLEVLMQLIHLSFVAPRLDPTAFAVYKANAERALANQQVEPDVVFGQAVAAAMTGDHPRTRPLTVPRLAEMSLERSMAFYRDRFADASDFTFVFVGSVELATLKPLVERYLASLPTLGRKETARDVGIRSPTTAVQREVRAGIEPKSQVSIVFSGPFENTEANRLLIRTMASTLSGNLHQSLREDLGGTYGVQVEPSFAWAPRQEYRVTITFACDPARTDRLVAETWDVIAAFKRSGPSPGQTADARTATAREIETNLQDNRYLLRRISQAYAQGEDVSLLLDPRRLVDDLVPARVAEAARRFLDESRAVQVVLRPAVP